MLIWLAPQLHGVAYHPKAAPLDDTQQIHKFAVIHIIIFF